MRGPFLESLQEFADCPPVAKMRPTMLHVSQVATLG